MAELATFWDRLADRYAASPIADQSAYEAKLAETRRHLRPDMDLFEFGCGTGSTAIVHAPHVRSIHAVDFSRRMLEIARSKAEAAGVGNIAFEQGDIATMALPAARYDMVLAMSILHLLSDREAAIRKVHEILRPGGLFVSSTACLGDSPLRLLRYVAPLGRALGKLPQLGFMTPAQLRDSLTGAGFVIEHDWRPKPGAALFLIARKPS